MVDLKLFKPDFSEKLRELQNKFPHLSEIQMLSMIAIYNEGIKQILILRKQNSTEKEK